MPGGRPTKYSPEILTQAEEYLAECVDVIEEYEDQEQQAHGGTLTRNRKPTLYVKIPTKEGLALYLGVTKPTLYEWEAKHKEFSSFMDKLGSAQASRLMQGGLAGTYNPKIAAILLTKHGYREGKDITTDDKPITAAAALFDEADDDHDEAS